MIRIKKHFNWFTLSKSSLWVIQWFLERKMQQEIMIFQFHENSLDWQDFNIEFPHQVFINFWISHKLSLLIIISSSFSIRILNPLESKYLKKRCHHSLAEPKFYYWLMKSIKRNICIVSLVDKSNLLFLCKTFSTILGSLVCSTLGHNESLILDLEISISSIWILLYFSHLCFSLMASKLEFWIFSG